ncbi:MAG: pirin family protein [Microbacteriaceae bacterium]|nr:pirin family protein [Microbacteriaceae bacterium]
MLAGLLVRTNMSQILETRSVKLNTRVNIEVRRTIPNRKLRSIGAFCFVDYFGPTDQTEAMVVAAHPHTGLQTVTWLFEGEVEHRDSIGSVQVIKPGQLNLMTAGKGISHSELSKKTQGRLHGIQLWVALEDKDRFTEPSFEHVNENQELAKEGMKLKVFMGELMGISSPAKLYSKLLAAEIELQPGEHVLDVDPEFEHGLLLVEGDYESEGEKVQEAELVYFETGQSKIKISVKTKTKLVLIGGEPFKERLVMWWNFIARSHAEIEEMRVMWNDQENREKGQDNFGVFEDEVGGWIPAPEMPNVQLRGRGQAG